MIYKRLRAFNHQVTQGTVLCVDKYMQDSGRLYVLTNRKAVDESWTAPICADSIKKTLYGKF